MTELKSSHTLAINIQLMRINYCILPKKYVHIPIDKTVMTRMSLFSSLNLHQIKSNLDDIVIIRNHAQDMVFEKNIFLFFLEK